MTIGINKNIIHNTYGKFFALRKNPEMGNFYFPVLAVGNIFPVYIAIPVRKSEYFPHSCGIDGGILFCLNSDG
ncbi:MAG: hypothetical protein Q8N88_01975 [Nanoarchaeota archaeon]|nr:hypothetical protein [Nanoarchaeota archaeon]